MWAAILGLIILILIVGGPDLWAAITGGISDSLNKRDKEDDEV